MDQPYKKMLKMSVNSRSINYRLPFNSNYAFCFLNSVDNIYHIVIVIVIHIEEDFEIWSDLFTMVHICASMVKETAINIQGMET